MFRDDIDLTGRLVTKPAFRCPAWLAVACAVVVAVLAAAWLLPAPNAFDGWLDLRVYRGAVQAMLGGHDLYGFAISDGAGAAPFLYPPFAALLVWPTLGMPLGSAATTWSLLQAGMAVVLVWLMIRGASWKPARDNLAGLAPVVAAVALFLLSRPVLFGINLGQVSLLIITLVSVDLLLVPPRWRGVLVGVAAAVKLTPLLFVVFFFASRQRRAAALAVVTFAAAGLAGFATMPAESVRYWTGVMFDTSRVPGIGLEKNLTILGALRFWGAPEVWQKPVWVLLGCLLVAAGLSRAVQHWQAGEPVAALLVAGATSAVVSPVTWDHFWVWLPMAGIYLAFGWPGRWRVAGWVTLVACAALSPIWPPPTSNPAGVWAAVAAIPVVAGSLIAVVGLPRHAGDARFEAAEEVPHASGA